MKKVPAGPELHSWCARRPGAWLRPATATLRPVACSTPTAASASTTAVPRAPETYLWSTRRAPSGFKQADRAADARGAGEEDPASPGSRTGGLTRAPPVPCAPAAVSLRPRSAPVCQLRRRGRARPGRRSGRRGAHGRLPRAVRCLVCQEPDHRRLPAPSWLKTCAAKSDKLDPRRQERGRIRDYLVARWRLLCSIARLSSRPPRCWGIGLLRCC